MTADFALAVNHFFIRQHRAEFRTPVHRNFRDVSRAARCPDRRRDNVEIGSASVRLRIEPGIVNLEENPLRPFVIIRIGRVDFALPIVAETDAFQLWLELGDVLARGDRGMLAGLDRVLLRGQTERIPAHRMQHVEAAHAFVARQDVGGGVTFRMSDVQPGAARIREHVEDVEFRFRRIEVFLARIGRVKQLPLIPKALPFGLEPIEGIWFAARAHVR